VERLRAGPAAYTRPGRSVDQQVDRDAGTRGVVAADAAKALKASGVSHVGPDLVTGAAIPVVPLLVRLSIRRSRKTMARDAE
jgi:hypothetical protein